MTTDSGTVVMAGLQRAVWWTGLAAFGLMLAACDLFASPARIAHYNVNVCTNLGNALDAPKDTDWGYTIQDDHFDIIKEAGFDSVRIPVRWSDHAGTRAPFTIDPSFMAEVEAIVDGALRRNLEVVLNVHHYEALYEQPAAELDRFVSLWSQIAEHFKHHPLALHFEILNEPRDALEGAILRDALSRAVATIRETNPARVLIIGGGDWNSLTGLEQLPVFDDPYIVGTFHYYTPHSFTHQDVPWEEEPAPLGATWGAPEDLATLETDVKRATAQVARLNRPVFLGEFGVYTSISDAERLEWYAAVREAFEAENIGWCIWNFGSDFALWDQETQSWKPGALDALGLAPPQAAGGISEAE